MLIKLIRNSTDIIHGAGAALNMPEYQPSHIKEHGTFDTIDSVLPLLRRANRQNTQEKLYFKYVEGTAYQRLQQLLKTKNVSLDRAERESVEEYVKRKHQIAQSSFYHAIKIAERCNCYGFASLAKLTQPLDFYKQNWPFELLKAVACSVGMEESSILKYLFELADEDKKDNGSRLHNAFHVK